jgi:Ca2+-binding EF-hand superfamily protein
LTVGEIRKGLRKSKRNKAREIEKVFNSIDMDNSGKIDYTEFIAVTMEKRIYL